MDEISKIINHCRHREYMSGIERDADRIKRTSEVFTTTDDVNYMLDKYDPIIFSDPTKTFLDPTAGDGQVLSEVLIRKVEAGIDFETALSTIFGVEKEIDNCKLCQDRLLCGREDLRHIVEKNVINGDSLTYHYKFDGTPPPNISTFSELFD